MKLSSKFANRRDFQTQPKKKLKNEMISNLAIKNIFPKAIIPVREVRIRRNHYYDIFELGFGIQVG